MSYQWFSLAEKHPELPAAARQSSDELLRHLMQHSPSLAGPSPALLSAGLCQRVFKGNRVTGVNEEKWLGEDHVTQEKQQQSNPLIPPDRQLLCSSCNSFKPHQERFRSGAFFKKISFDFVAFLDFLFLIFACMSWQSALAAMMQMCDKKGEELEYGL